jgi:hypothetical protein
LPPCDMFLLTRTAARRSKAHNFSLFDVSASQLRRQITGTLKTATCHLVPATEHAARKSIAAWDRFEVEKGRSRGRGDRACACCFSRKGTPVQML